MYITNRVFDLIDIVRVDVGVGPAFGAVLRVSRHAQMGYRKVQGSARLGLRGRRIPLFYEDNDEKGVSPKFTDSPDRKVEGAEVGVGVDLLVVGAYLGVSGEEILDFFAGIIGFDPQEDDQ